MLRPRIIPCLLAHKGGLVKTVQFDHPKYVGDPINVVRIFNEKQVDELALFDIDATIEGRGPDYKLISCLAAESRMPLAYGGGIKTLDQARAVISLGVEKVAISSAAVENPQLVAEISQAVGSQSVVVVLDVKKRGDAKGYEVWTHNGRVNTGLLLADIAIEVQRLGAGEIVVNAIERDGTMLGYDLELAQAIDTVSRIPITILGGAGSFEHVSELVRRFGVVGAGAGSLFVFKGAYRAVLVNYPTHDQRSALAREIDRAHKQL